MTKEKDKEVRVNQPDGAPIAPKEVNTPASLETLSHQWQDEKSPAINTNALAGYATENLVDNDRAAEAAAKEDKKEKRSPLSAEEYERRTKLDVSDKDYINPSLDHFDVKK